MKFRRWLVVCSLLVAACGSGDTEGSRDGGQDGALDGSQPEGGTDGGMDAAGDAAPVQLDTRYLPMAKSGSRLHARVFQVPGAPDVFAGWFDSALGVACHARAAVDGTIRCLPVNSVYAATVRLSDDCTGGSGLLDEQLCGATTYDLLGEALSEELASCENNGLATRVQSWSSEPWSGGYSRDDTGVCVAVADPPEGAISLLESSEVAPSSFARLTYRLEALDSGLQVRFEESSDGASRVTGLYMTDAGACSFRTLERGTDYCVPEHVAFEEGSGTFLDSECTRLAAYVSPSYDVECSGEPKFSFVRGQSGSDVYTIGPERTGDDVLYVQDGDTCAARSVTEIKSTRAYIGRLFEISDSLAALPRLLPVAIGEGTVRARYYATPEGVVAHESYDQAFASSGSGLRVRTVYEDAGEGCVVWETAEQGLRCLPAQAALDVSFDPRFSDDACSDRIAKVGTWTTITGRDPELVYAVEQGECESPQGAGLATTEVVSGFWRVTGKIEADSQPIYERVDGECFETESSGEVHFTLEPADLSGYLQPTVSTLAP